VVTAAVPAAVAVWEAGEAGQVVAIFVATATRTYLSGWFASVIATADQGGQEPWQGQQEITGFDFHEAGIPQPAAGQKGKWQA
jgi:hypothetical protein